MNPGTINRQYIPSYGADHDAMKHGLSWLINSENETLALYVPTLQQVDSGTVLTSVLGENNAKQFRKNGIVSINGKNINLITNKVGKFLQSPVRLLACWIDSKDLGKIEQDYKISNILVITWNSKTDIEEWKKRHKPIQFQEYTPKPAPEKEW